MRSVEREAKHFSPPTVMNYLYFKRFSYEGNHLWCSKIRALLRRGLQSPDPSPNTVPSLRRLEHGSVIFATNKKDQRVARESYSGIR